MAADDVFRVTLHWTIDGQPASNVLHIKETVGPGSGEDQEQTLANGLEGILATSLYPEQSTKTKLKHIVVQRISPTTGMLRVFNLTSSAGTDTGEPLPPGATLTTSLYGTTNTKRSRGRIRWPGISLAKVTNSNVEVASLGNLNTLINALTTAWTYGGATLRFVLTVWSALDTAAYTIIQAKNNPDLRNLRKRRPKPTGF